RPPDPGPTRPHVRRYDAPLTSSTAPEDHRASGEARYTTAAATSSGVPTRPNGLCARSASPCSPASFGACRSVATTPGATEATATPCGASVRASDCPSACTAALVAAYAGWSGSPRNAPREPTLTIAPPVPAATRCRAAAQLAWAVPSRLTRTIVSHAAAQSSNGVSWTVWTFCGSGPTAALFTSTESPPSCAAASSTRAVAAAGSPRSPWTRTWPVPGSAASVCSASARPWAWWTATRSPRSAKASATARPMPRDEPVTRTPREGRTVVRIRSPEVRWAAVGRRCHHPAPRRLQLDHARHHEGRGDPGRGVAEDRLTGSQPGTPHPPRDHGAGRGGHRRAGLGAQPERPQPPDRSYGHHRHRRGRAAPPVPRDARRGARARGGAAGSHGHGRAHAPPSAA